MEAILTIVSAACIIPLLLILRGFVLSKLWVWFITPIFSFRPLTIPEAIGIAVIVSFLIASNSHKDEKQTNATVIISGVFYQLFGLLLGFIIHLFL